MQRNINYIKERIPNMKILLIPSAKVVNDELKEKFGIIPNVMVPLNGKTILDNLYEKYVNSFDHIIVLVKEKSDIIEQYITIKNMKIKLVEIDKIVNLGYTIKCGFDFIKNNLEFENIEEIIINLGDTLVDDVDISELNNSILYANVDEPSRWTTFEYSNCKIINLYDKIEHNRSDCPGFVGVFGISNIHGFYNSLQKSVNSTTSESFYDAIIDYNNNNDFHFIKTDGWLDVGHADKYLKSKREVKARYFNTIDIDKDRGIVTKRSDDKNKFYYEILWYLKLPLQIQYLAPRIFNYSLDYNDMYVSMEYYGYNTLNELFVYSDLNNQLWEKIFSSIFFTIDDMSKYKFSLNKEQVIKSISEMYVNKTINRLSKLKSDDKFNIFFSSNIEINGHTFFGIDYYSSKLNSLMEKYDIYNIDSFNIIHGDFCFSNILYDTNADLIRLIDPRGKFGEYDIYGDIRYDLAKISHSVMGKYDFIINDLFSIKVDGNKLNYKLNHSNNLYNIEKIFLKYVNEYGYDINQIKLIEACLFLSMIPLHKDRPNRQYAMLATGIQIIDSLC